MKEGREFEPYHEFMGFKIIPWFRGIEISNEDNIIYSLGDECPYAYPTERLKNPPHDPKIPCDELFDLFNSDPNTERITGLSIGSIYPKKGIEDEVMSIRKGKYEIDEYYEEEDDLIESRASVFNEFCLKLTIIKSKLKSLKRLIIGNYYMDELFHIVYDFHHFKEVIEAFPNLELLLVRGLIDFPPIEKTHNNLKYLIVEAMGIKDTGLRNIMKYKFPQLEHLELYTGTDYWRIQSNGYRDQYYEGCDEKTDSSIFKPLFAGNLFPKLKFLGIKDCDSTDEIAYDLASSNILKKLDVLDLSLGTLSDYGAEMLINSPNLDRLKLIDLRSHYCTQSCAKYIISQAKKRKINLLMEKEPIGNIDNIDRNQTVRE